MPTITGFQFVSDLAPGRVVFLNGADIHDIQGTITSPATIRFYVAGSATPEATFPIVFDFGLKQVNDVALSLGVKDVDVVDGTGTSAKLTNYVEIVPRAAITAVSPNPIAPGDRVTITGTDLEWLTIVRIMDLADVIRFDFQSQRASLDADAPFVHSSEFGGGNSGPVNDIVILATFQATQVQFTMPDLGIAVGEEFRIDFEFQLDFDAADGPDETFYGSSINAVVGQAGGTNPDPTPSVVAPEEYSDRAIVNNVLGSDTLGAGTEHAPYKTITGAIEATTGNVIIIADHGDYAELVTIPKGRSIWIKGRGGITRIDGEFVRDCVSVESGSAATDTDAAVAGGILLLEDVHLIRPVGYAIAAKRGLGVAGAGLSDGRIRLVNCVVLANDEAGYVTFVRKANNYVIEFYGCTIKGFDKLLDDGSEAFGGGNTGLVLTVTNSIMDSPSSLFPPLCTSGRTVRTAEGLDLTKSQWTAIVVRNNAYPNNLATNEIDTNFAGIPYVDGASGPDQDLSLDPAGPEYESYIERGYRLGLVGSTYYARLGFNAGAGPSDIGTGAASAACWKDHQSFGNWENYTAWQEEDPARKTMFRTQVTGTSSDALAVGDGWSLTDPAEAASGQVTGAGAIISDWMRVPVRNGQVDVSMLTLLWEADLEATDSVTAFWRFAPTGAYGGSGSAEPPEKMIAEATIPWFESAKGEALVGGGAAFDVEYVYVQMYVVLEIGEVSS